MSKRVLRVLDTDFGDSRKHFSFGKAMVDHHKDEKQPDTLRFMHFTPTVILGRHQVLHDEVNVDYCQNNNIQIVRRLTGGGAVFLDPGQLAWELCVSKKNIGSGDLSKITEILCGAAAGGLNKLNIDANFRPRNDLEVNGRKIGGTGGFFDGDTLFFQGGALVDMDVENMKASLNIPVPKLSKRNLETAGDRVITVRELLGDDTPPIAKFKETLVESVCETLGLKADYQECSPSELSLGDKYYDEEIGQDEFVHEIDRLIEGDVVKRATVKTPGGFITASIKLKGPKLDIIAEIFFHGDLFVSPPRVLFDLEAHLKGVFLTGIEDAIHGFFKQTKINMMSIQPDHFVSAIEEALKGEQK